MDDRVVLITRVSSSSAFDLVGRGLGADGADVFQGALSNTDGDAADECIE